MTQLVVRHKVADYGKWKTVFDEHDATRKASGCKGYQLVRNVDDPNELIVVMEWDDLKNAREFAGSEDLREIMGRAGVTDAPDVYFCDTLEQRSS